MGLDSFYRYAWNGISYSDSVDFDYGCYDDSFGIDDECPTIVTSLYHSFDIFY